MALVKMSGTLARSAYRVAAVSRQPRWVRPPGAEDRASNLRHAQTNGKSAMRQKIEHEFKTNHDRYDHQIATLCGCGERFAAVVRSQLGLASFASRKARAKKIDHTHREAHRRPKGHA